MVPVLGGFVGGVLATGSAVLGGVAGIAVGLALGAAVVSGAALVAWGAAVAGGAVTTGAVALVVAAGVGSGRGVGAATVLVGAGVGSLEPPIIFTATMIPTTAAAPISTFTIIPPLLAMGRSIESDSPVVWAFPVEPPPRAEARGRGSVCRAAPRFLAEAGAGVPMAGVALAEAPLASGAATCAAGLAAATGSGVVAVAGSSTWVGSSATGAGGEPAGVSPSCPIPTMVFWGGA